MPKKYHKKPVQQQKIAKKRINFLFQHANEVFKEDSNLSDKYVKMARRIAMKVRLKLPKTLRRKFCKHCLYFLRPGVNCRVRTRKKMLVVYCQNCRKFMRFGLGWCWTYSLKIGSHSFLCHSFSILIACLKPRLINSLLTMFPLCGWENNLGRWEWKPCM